MAFTTGSIVITMAGGTPTAVNGGTTLQDGTYTITVTQDNTGVSLACVTPYGVTGQTGFTKGDDIS
jgi:hypothetical protein